MKLSVIIINYNTFALTCDCIRSVLRHTKMTDYEIILVDNASTECDPEKFKEQFPQLILVKSSVNGGFAQGNNLGIEKAAGEYILLLNSDTVLQEDSIGKSLARMEAQPDIGVLGCKLVFPDGKVQYSVRRFKSIGWELLNIFRFILWLMPYKKRARLMLGKYTNYEEDTDCDWIGGAFFLVRRSIIGQLPGGKLDERFFMYGEDHLWCEQVRELGYRIHYFAGTTVIHIHGGSTDIGKQIATRRLMARNELEIMRIRKGNGLYYYVYRLLFLTIEGIRNFYKMIFFRLTGRHHY